MNQNDPAATIFGIAVAVIVCGGLAYFLRGLADGLPLWMFMALCGAIVAACYLLARFLDKRTAAREESGRYDPPST